MSTALCKVYLMGTVRTSVLSKTLKGFSCNAADGGSKPASNAEDRTNT